MKQFYFKMIKIPTVTAFFGILFLLASQGMQAATITSTSLGGDWNSTSTWVGGVVPANSTADKVIIVSGATVTLTLTANFTVGGLNIEQGAELKVSSNATANTFTIGVLGSTISGPLSFDNTVNGTKSFGTVTVTSTGSVIETVIKSISMNNGAQGVLTNYGIVTTGTLALSGTNANLMVVNNYGTINTTGVSTTSVGTINNYSGGILNISGTIAGTIKNYGTINSSSFSGSATTSNIYNYSTGLINYTGGSMTAAYLVLDASATGNTVNYSLAGSQTIKDVPYSNLTLSNSGTKTWSQAADRTISGDLTINSGVTLKLASASVSLVNVTSGGSGYGTTVPTVSFSAPPTGGTSPTGTAFLTNGAVSSVVITNPGCGYTTAPTVTIGTQWATSTTYTANTQVWFGGNLYNVKTGGNSGTVPPTHTSGDVTATGGTAVLTYAGVAATATTTLYSSPSTYKLTVAGTTTNNGTITVDALAGTGDKTFSTFTNTGTFTLPLGNLVISNALTTSGTFTLSGTSSLTVAPAATFTITGGTNNSTNLGGRPVTFKSDASGTARFGTLANTSYLTGATNVTVERYIPAKRAFRLLSSPVTTTTSIKANYQENLGTTAGLGTHITGLNGASNGFDPSATNNPSLFTHDNAAQAWSAVTNTATTVLTAGTPYRIMVRGDRSMDITNDPTTTPSPTATTLRATGTLKTGNVSLTTELNQNPDGFSLIGNPYQSPVDMAATLSSATNLKNFYFVWDPNLGTRGAYVTRDLLASTNNITSNVDNYLQPGQACFVQTNLAAPATLSFTEANKYTTATNQNVFRPASPAATQATPSASIRLTLYNKTALANQGTPTDGAVVLFNATSANEVDANDCSKMTNLDENLAFNTNGNLLSIEHRAVPTAADEIQLAITQYRAKEYTLVAESSTIDGLTPYLVDQYTKTATAIPAAGSINYNFTVDPSNANSSAANRFKIIFQDTTSVTEFTENEVKVYPNPSTGGMVSISLPFIQQESKVSVLNFAGETIYSTTIAAGDNAAINPDKSLALGIYFVKIEQAGKTVTKKLIIK